jgi:hypothetical protein
VPDQNVAQDRFGSVPDQYGSVRPSGREMAPGAIKCKCPDTLSAFWQRVVGVSVFGLPYSYGIACSRHAGSVRAESNGRRGFGALVSPTLGQGVGRISDTVHSHPAILAAYRRESPVR